jgi:hypothetical protein
LDGRFSFAFEILGPFKIIFCCAYFDRDDWLGGAKMRFIPGGQSTCFEVVSSVNRLLGVWEWALTFTAHLTLEAERLMNIGALNRDKQPFPAISGDYL